MRLILLGLLTMAYAWSIAATGSAAPLSTVDQGAEPDAERSQTLVIGRISFGAQKQLTKVAALNDYTVSELAGLGIGISTGRAVVERTVAEMTALMAGGGVDYVTESLYGAIRLEAEGGGEIVLQEWKSGTPYFRAFLISPAEADIRMDALQGAHILFEDAGSTSGYFLPYVHLRSKGYRLARQGTKGAASKDVITYSFTGAEITTTARLARSKAELGAISNYDWDNTTKTPLSLRPALRIIAETAVAPRRLVIVRQDLDPRVKQALIGTLTAMADRADGQSALHDYKADKFGPLSPETARQIKAAHATYKIYGEELE